ncbi:LysR substrate-binding domain-containing protein, partial [Staphylococcus kloosii]
VNSAISNNHITKHLLSSEEIVIVAHNKAPDSLEDLLKNKPYNHLVINEKDSTYRKMFEEFLNDNNLGVGKETELWSINAIKTFLTDNMGFSVLPLRTVEDEIRDNTLKVISKRNDFPLFYSFALTKKKNWQNDIVNLFVEEAQK